ncbi:MAG: hypothetical protein IKK39_13810 [Thermoguttaceae bacterium]|nr:hypothetical protein [Thermoguttaceae bacterium]MBR4105123.1 hypothetical protein [Thermoguttaceae bacterium]
MEQQAKTTEEAKPEVLQELKRLEHKLGELCESVNCMDAEIDDAIERFKSVKDRVDRLLTDKAELAKELKRSYSLRDELRDGAENDALKLRRELKDERLAVKRLQNALDAALNDVAIWKRAAFGFGLAAVAALCLAIVAATF